MSQPPQLQLSLPPITTSFKRSFAQFGFDLDSPGTATGSSSNEGSDGGSGAPDENNERSKRARSDPSSERLDDRRRRRRAGHHRIHSSNGSSSSSGATQSGEEASGSSSTIASDSPRSELDEAAEFIVVPVNEHPPRLPTPEIQDIEMLPVYQALPVPVVNPSASLSPTAASESWPFDSEGNETNLLLVSNDAAPRIPTGSLTNGLAYDVNSRSPSPSPASQEERFQLTLERFNAFDNHMNALRHTPDSSHDDEGPLSFVSATRNDSQPAMSSSAPFQHSSPPPQAGPSSPRRQSTERPNQNSLPISIPIFSEREEIHPTADPDATSLTAPRSPVYTPLSLPRVQQSPSIHGEQNQDRHPHYLQPYVDIFRRPIRSPTPPPTLPPLEGRLGPRLDMPEFEEELREVRVNAGVVPPLFPRDGAGWQRPGGVQGGNTNDDGHDYGSSSSTTWLSTTSLSFGASLPVDSITSGSSSRLPMSSRISPPVLANPVPTRPTDADSPQTRPSSTRPWEWETATHSPPWQLANIPAIGSNLPARISSSSSTPPLLEVLDEDEPTLGGPSSSSASGHQEHRRRSSSQWSIASESDASTFTARLGTLGDRVFDEDDDEEEESARVFEARWADAAGADVGAGESTSSAGPVASDAGTSTRRRLSSLGVGGDFLSRLDEALHHLESDPFPVSEFRLSMHATGEADGHATGASTSSLPARLHGEDEGEESVATDEAAVGSEAGSSRGSLADTEPPQLPPLLAGVSMDLEVGNGGDSDADMEQDRDQDGTGQGGGVEENARQQGTDQFLTDSLSSLRSRLGLEWPPSAARPGANVRRPSSRSSFTSGSASSTRAVASRSPDLYPYLITDENFPRSRLPRLSMAGPFPPFGEAAPVRAPRFSADLARSQGASSSTRSIARSTEPSSGSGASAQSGSRAMPQPSSNRLPQRSSLYGPPYASLHAGEDDTPGNINSPRSYLPSSTYRDIHPSELTPLRVEHQPPSPLLHELHQWLSPPEPESPPLMSNPSEEELPWWNARVTDRQNMDVDADIPRTTERDNWIRSTRHRDILEASRLAAAANPGGSGNSGSSLNPEGSSSGRTSWMERDRMTAWERDWVLFRGDRDRRTEARRQFELQRRLSASSGQRIQREPSPRRPPGVQLSATPTARSRVVELSPMIRMDHDMHASSLWDGWGSLDPALSTTTREPDSQNSTARHRNLDPINLTDPVYSTHRPDIEQPPLPIRFSGFSPHFAPHAAPPQPSDTESGYSGDIDHNPFRTHFRLSSNSLVSESAVELRRRSARAQLIRQRNAQENTNRIPPSAVMPQAQDDMMRDASIAPGRASQSSLPNQSYATGSLFGSMHQDREHGHTSEEEDGQQEARLRRRSNYRAELFSSRSPSSSPVRNPATFEDELERAVQGIFGSGVSPTDNRSGYYELPMRSRYLGASPHRDVPSLPSPDLGRVFDSNGMRDREEGLANYLYDIPSALGRAGALLERDSAQQARNERTNADGLSLDHRLQLPSLASASRNPTVAEADLPTISPTSLTQAFSSSATAENGSVRNMDPNLFHPGPFRNTIRHFTQANRIREERLRARHNPPPSIPPLSLGGADLPSFQQPPQFGSHPPSERRNAPQPAGPTMSRSGLSHDSPITQHPSTMPRGGTSARPPPPASDVHRLLGRRARMANIRMENFESNTNSTSRSDAEGFSHAIEVLRTDGLTTARSQHLSNHHRQDHPDSELPDASHRFSQPSSSSNVRPLPGHAVRGEPRPIPGHQAHGRYGMTRSDAVMMFGPGRRRRLLGGRAIGDYVRDEDFDPSYEGLISLAATLGEVKPKATPAEVISGLETGLYKDWQTPDSDKRCPICLDDYGPEDTLLKLAKCSHWMHRDCLHQWLNGASTCPVCREPVSSASSRRAPPNRYRGTFGLPDHTRPNMRRDPPGGGGLGSGGLGPYGLFSDYLS